MPPLRRIAALSLCLSCVIATVPTRAHAAAPTAAAPTPSSAVDDPDTLPPDTSEPDVSVPASRPTNDPDGLPGDEAPASVDESDASPQDDAPPPTTDEPAPKVYDYDRPDLDRRDPYPELPAAGEAARRARRRAKVGGIFAGVALASSVVAPLVIMRPRPTITVDPGDGSSVAQQTNAGPLVTGSIIGVTGGVMGVLGGRFLSDLGVEPARAGRRQRGLAVVSGVAFGVAGGMVLAGIVDLARGRVLWNEVLARDFSIADYEDADDAFRRMSRGLALFASALPIAGLGVGLSLGGDARAQVTPTRNGVAVLGRF